MDRSARLDFPDASRTDLERSIEELVINAERVRTQAAVCGSPLAARPS